MKSDDNHRRNDHLINAIKARFEETGLNSNSASLIGTGGKSRDLFRKILEGKVWSPRADKFPHITKALNVTEEWLINAINGGSLPPQAMTKPTANDPIPYSPGRPPDPARMIPIMGTASGSIVDHKFEGTDISGPVDYVAAPPALQGTRDLYAIYVTGESMLPQHNPGELRFVHPHRPPQPGSTVIVQTRQWNDDPGQSYIKILERRTAGKVILRQLNPPATIEIPAEHVTKLHKVLTMNELFGV